MSNSIINALKRLERAGSENSRATQKLYDAAIEVACFIEKNVPAGVDLPRGYKVKEVRSNIGTALFLVKETDFEFEYIDGLGDYLHGDYNCLIPGQKRATILKFAEDVATGLLNEISEFLHARAKKSLEGAEKLTNALKKGDVALE